MTCLLSHMIAVLFFNSYDKSTRQLSELRTLFERKKTLDYFANELSLVHLYPHTFELRNGFGYINKENL